MHVERVSSMLCEYFLYTNRVASGKEEERWVIEREKERR